MLIAHISDLHIDNTNKKNNMKRFEALLDYLNGRKIDHLIITGDITQNAKISCMQEVRDLLIDKGFFSSDKTTVIIGNHDIYGGVHYAYDIVQFPSRCRNTNFEKKVMEFSEVFSELFNNCKYPVNKEFYPFAKDLGPVVLFGLNSIARYSYLKNAFASNGNVPRIHIKLLSEMFYDHNFHEKKKIVLIHHHFNPEVHHKGYASIWMKLERQTMKLYRKKRLLRLFSKHGVDMVLHGHRHEIREYEKKGIKFINMGGSILSFYSDMMHVNLITVEDGIISNSIEAVRYDKVIRKIIKNTDPSQISLN
jgi:3',5'-cyclic AMP phosphodiesterase CpdA